MWQRSNAHAAIFLCTARKKGAQRTESNQITTTLDHRKSRSTYRFSTIHQSIRNHNPTFISHSTFADTRAPGRMTSFTPAENNRCGEHSCTDSDSRWRARRSRDSQGGIREGVFAGRCENVASERRGGRKKNERGNANGEERGKRWTDGLRAADGSETRAELTETASESSG